MTTRQDQNSEGGSSQNHTSPDFANKMPLMHELVYGALPPDNSDRIRVDEQIDDDARQKENQQNNSADIIVCIALDTTSVKFRRLFVTQNGEDRLRDLTNGTYKEIAQNVPDLTELMEKGPRLLQLVWCICQMREEFKVVDFDQVIVNPGGEINQQTTERSRLTQEIVSQQGVSVAQSILKLTTQLKQLQGEEKSRNVRFCSFGDWPIKYQLQLEALRCNEVKLPEAFTENFTNVLELYYELCKMSSEGQAHPVKNVDDLLEAFQLEVRKNEEKSRAENDLVSLVRALNQMVRKFRALQQQSNSKLNVDVNEKQRSNRSRSRSYEETKNKQAVEEESTMQLQLRNQGSIVSKTQKQQSNNDPDSLAALKLQNVPFKADNSIIQKLFAKNSFEPCSILMGQYKDGRRTGDAAVLFSSETDAMKACQELDGQKIMHRRVQMSLITRSEHDKFLQIQRKSNIDGVICADNLHRCLKLRGMPHNTSKRDIQNFFAGFSLREADIHLERQSTSDRQTGNAVVVLKDRHEVQKAKQKLDQRYIGNRYVDVVLPLLRDLC